MGVQCGGRSLLSQKKVVEITGTEGTNLTLPSSCSVAAWLGKGLIVFPPLFQIISEH